MINSPIVFSQQSESTIQGTSIRIVYRFVESTSEEIEDDSIQPLKDSHPKPVDSSQKARCPQCASTHITANKRGYDFVYGILGAAVTMNILGMIFGAVGSDNIEVNCLNCGYTWTIRR